MNLSDATREKIEACLAQDRVVLFMKGTPNQPMCGFSAKTAGMLDSLLDSYASVDVLSDQDIREGIKAFGQWPTIPQLYIDKELVGGCDIVTAMFNNGELHEYLGMEAPDRTPPEVTITDKAVEMIKQAVEGHDDVGLHLQVDGDWSARFSLAPAEGNEIVSESNGITLLFDLASAQRARGAVIDWVDTVQGEGLSINFPGAPKPIPQMSVQDLKSRLDADDITLVDVRTEEERATASVDGAINMDAEAMQRLEAMPLDTPMAFICHTGSRSQIAAEHFQRQGFTEVHNVAGGIHAWSQEIDPSVPTY